MSDVIDLARLERLAAEATGERWTVGYWPLPEPTHYVGAVDVKNPISSKLAAHVTGAIREEDAAYVAACDPATVAALVQAVRAALKVAGATYGSISSYDFYTLRKALAVFSDTPEQT